MTNPERVQRIIADQELDTLVAYSSDRSRKLDMVHGTVQDCQTAVLLMEESFAGPYILEGYNADKATRTGRKADTEKPFVWVMRGVQDQHTKGAPAPAPERVTVTKEVPVPDAEAIKAAAEARADARIAEARAEALSEELEALSGELDEGEDEGEEMESPAPIVMPWWTDADKTMQVAERVTGLLGKLMASNAPKVPKTEGITEEERELLEMTRKWRLVQPDQFEVLTSQLKENFASNGNGNAATSE